MAARPLSGQCVAVNQPFGLDQEPSRWQRGVLAVVRCSSWLFLGILLLAGVGGVVGGVVTTVVGAAQTDWSDVARGIVSLLVGGAWLALAHVFREAGRSPQQRTP